MVIIAASDIKPEPEPEPEPEAEFALEPEVGLRVEARRAALAGMRIGDLKKEAQSVGLSMDLVDEAIDYADDPKAAVIELIVMADSKLKPEQPAQKSVPLMLSSVPLLMHLSACDKERIHDMLEAQTFAAGATILAEGDIVRDDASCMYFMESGEAIATVNGEFSTRYMRGGYFGELALLTNAARKATVCAGSTGARCLKLSRQGFQGLEFNEAMLQAQQDLYESITDKLSVKRKTKTATQQKQHRSLADKHFGNLRGIGAGMITILGSDAKNDGSRKLRLSDVVDAKKAGLNTPVFVAALSQEMHDNDTILKIRARVLAAINAGHYPNSCPTSNRDAVAGIMTLYHYYHTTIMRGAERTRDGARGEESERGKATLPTAFQMKVALAAGLPRTLGALRGLFKPERAWKDTFDFREALGEAVGLESSSVVGSPGTQIIPVFEAVAAEDETLDLISFDTGGPKVLIDWLGVIDPVAEGLIWEY